MGQIIAWLILGLISGSLAKLSYPGKQGGGIFATIGLGLLGALVGGYLGKLILGISSAAASSAVIVSIPSIIFAVAGSMLLIFVWGLIRSNAA